MSKKSRKLSRKRILMVVAIVGVLVLAGVAGVLLRFAQQKQAADNDNNFTPGKDLPKSVNDSQALSIQGKGDEANQKIQDALTKDPGTDAKYELYIQQGINYQNQKDYTKALDSYRQAEAIKADYKVTLLIADDAMAMGNKPLALQYYTKALSLLPADDPLHDSDKARLESSIKAAGG